MARNRIPGDVVRNLLEQGEGPKAIADVLLEKYGLEFTPQAISTWRARHTDIEAAWSTARVVPWTVKPEHRTSVYRSAILAYKRREKGKRLGPESQRNLDYVEAKLAATGQVIDYSPKAGWLLVPRRPTDVGIYRDPEIETTREGLLAKV